jgi:transcriptional regulator with XRE-family HTH domain
MTKPTAQSALGTTIRESRNKRGWSQVELGRQAGVSRPTIARIEHGEDVSTATLTLVAQALGLAVELKRTGDVSKGAERD